MTELIEEGEIIDETETALAIREPAPPPTTLFGTDDPAAVVEAARRAAQPLAAVVREQKLFVKIGQGEHVKVEGWTLLGSMLGVFPVVTWTHKLEDGWEAQVEARTRRGDVVGCAEAMCTRGETRWAKADEYAIRSMAQTRATSKALRQPLGFVMQLAGYNPTPAEEMPREPRKRSSQKTELAGRDVRRRLRRRPGGSGRRESVAVGVAEEEAGRAGRPVARVGPVAYGAFVCGCGPDA
jgi:hypothetical protein